MATPLELWSNEEYEKKNTPIIADSFSYTHPVVACVSDAYEFLCTLPSNLAQLIITSPPYNIGKEYETRVKIHEYLHGQEKVIDELVRVLDHNGSLCWQVGNYVEKGESFPLDIWDIVVEQWEEEVWEIPQVKAAHPEKTEHPAQYPIELVERCVLALTNENDWVLDPYCGVGSSLIAGLKHNRRVIGCDKEERYIEIAKERVRTFYNGRLPMRPIERELYEPQGKVAKVPDEWKSGNVKHVYHDAGTGVESTNVKLLFDGDE